MKRFKTTFAGIGVTLGALLLVLASCGFGSTADRFKIRVQGEIRDVTASELADGVRAGTVADTTSLFADGRWMVVKDYEPAARILRGARQPATATAGSPGSRGSAPGSAAPAAPPVLVINESAPGELVTIMDHRVAGKTTIFDFYSEYCPPCVAVAPHLADFAASHPDYVIRKIDINRSGVSGIDWESPVAEQYGLQSIPYFVIVDGAGRQVADGHAATQLIDRWLTSGP